MKNRFLTTSGCLIIFILTRALPLAMVARSEVKILRTLLVKLPILQVVSV